MKSGYTGSNDTVTGGGIGKTHTFRIMADKDSFLALSSKLYSDPVRAVIRELGCNAYDAHVAVGKKDVPFEVFLPTAAVLKIERDDAPPQTFVDNYLAAIRKLKGSDCKMSFVAAR